MNKEISMRNNLTLTLAATIAAIGLSACDTGPEGKSVENEVPIAPQTIIRGTSDKDKALFKAVSLENVIINIIDAATGKPISIDANKPIRFTIDDVNEVGAIQLSENSDDPNFSDDKTYEFYSAISALTFQINEDLESDDYPVTLRAQVEADGYFSSGTTIIISENTSNVVASISLINKEAPPSNVKVKAMSVNPADGGTVETAGGEASGRFTLKPTSGLEGLEAGDLEIQLAYFDPSNTNADAVFPGGLNFESDTENSPASGGGIFTTAGFMAIDITDKDGNKAHKLADNAVLRFNIPAGLDNPESTSTPKEKVKAGDVIPIWSRDDITGKWKMENGVTAVKDDNGQLYIEYTTDHLSYYNLDWYNGRCNGARDLTFEGDFTMPTNGIMVNIKNDSISFNRNAYFYDKENELYNSPDRSNLTTFTASYDGKILGETTVANCDPISVSIDETQLPPVPELIDISVSASVVAPASVTYWDIYRILDEAEVSPDTKNKVLNFTHPQSLPETGLYWADYPSYQARSTLRAFSDLYQGLLDEGILDRDQIAIIQTVMATQFVLENATYYYYIYDQDGRFLSYGNGNTSVDIKINVSVGNSIYISFSGEIDGTYIYGSEMKTLTDDEIDTKELDIKIPNAVAISAIYRALVDQNKIPEELLQ